jgi:4-amino-4-deoxy-L-arabinose transferase-like glycosyltransferase
MLVRFQKKPCILALLAILAFACLAYVSFRTQNRIGFLWLCVSGVLLAVFTPPLVSVEYPPTLPLVLSNRRRLWIAFGLLLVGALLLANSARIFALQLNQTVFTNADPWNWYIFGLGLWIAGAWLLGQRRQATRLGNITILFFILGIAIFLRVYLLDSLPTGIWYDEAANGLEARQILHNSAYRPVFASVNMTLPHLGLYALMLGLFGETNIVALRLVSAIFAIGSVWMGYWVGRELRGHTFGLLLSLMLATMHWSINFSRIAMNGIEIVFFVLLALYFIIRLMRFAQVRDAVLAGLAIGIGLWFYRAFQVTLLAFGMLILTGWTYRPWKRSRVLGGVLIATSLAVIFPLIIFALTRTEYWDRVNQVSIFGSESRNVAWNDALIKSIPLHLEMFHIQGDKNGRHNLPGEPMLDSVTGILFGIGLLVAMREWRHRENLFFLAILILGLSGGILTVTFEAPQSLRSIGVLPAVAYFAALGALALGQCARMALPTIFRRLSTTPLLRILGLTVVLTGLNYQVYFQEQRFDYRVWSAYSTVETLAGRILAEQSEDTLIYTSPFIFNHISGQFLAEEQTKRSQLLKIPDVLPVRLPPDHKVVMLFVPLEHMLYQLAQRLYPNAVFRTISSKDYGVEPSMWEPDLFYVVELSPEDIASVQGLAPDGSGIFYAPYYGDYHFVLPENTVLHLNGQIFTEREFTVNLPQGNQQIQILPPKAQLSWIQEGRIKSVPMLLFYHAPVSYHGVLAAYYANSDWKGDPVTIETHPFIYQRVQILPMPRPYSVKYTGQLFAPISGEYHFHMSAIDYAQLIIDGRAMVETSEPNKRFSESLMLTEGWHEIEVRYQDLTSHTFVFLEWTLPGDNQITPVSIDYLRPRDLSVGKSHKHSLLSFAR